MVPVVVAIGGNVFVGLLNVLVNKVVGIIYVDLQKIGHLFQNEPFLTSSEKITIKN